MSKENRERREKGGGRGNIERGHRSEGCGGKGNIERRQKGREGCGGKDSRGEGKDRKERQKKRGQGARETYKRETEWMGPMGKSDWRKITWDKENIERRDKGEG